MHYLLYAEVPAGGYTVFKDSLVRNGVLDGPSMVNLMKPHVFGPSRTPVLTGIN